MNQQPSPDSSSNQLPFNQNLQQNVKESTLGGGIQGIHGNDNVQLQAVNTGQIIVINTNRKLLLDTDNSKGFVLKNPSLQKPILLRPISKPVKVFPPPLTRPLLDRKDGVKQVLDALKASERLIEFYGQEELGKTTLLRYLAHHPQINSLLPDKMLYLCAHEKSVEGLLQDFCDFFCENEGEIEQINSYFSPNKIRQVLKETQAAVLLDDVNLPRKAVVELTNALPNFIFIIASSERYFWGEGCSIMLSGLPLNDSIILVKRELGRELTLEENSAAEALCTILNGHPQQILKAAARVSEENISLVKVSQQIKSTSPTKALDWEILKSLSQPQRLTLETLTALGTWLLPEQVAALTGLNHLQTILETLLKRNLVQINGSRYKVTRTVGETLEQIQNLTPLRENALSYFITWAEQHQSVPHRIFEEADTILQILQQTVVAGRWTDILYLCRLVENAFVFSRRWEMWSKVLNYALQAARAMDDKAAEAWALHQLGTCALCRENINLSRELLTQALNLRESLGDEIGIAVTRQNLNFASPVISPSTPTLTKPKPLLQEFLPSFLYYGKYIAISGMLHVLGFPLVLSIISTFYEYHSPLIPMNSNSPQNDVNKVAKVPYILVDLISKKNSSFPNLPNSQSTSQPTPQPTSQPTQQPTSQPTPQPTSQPTQQPTSQPTPQPTSQPTQQPTSQPTQQPTSQPTPQPTSQPTPQPTSQPSPIPKVNNSPSNLEIQLLFARNRLNALEQYLLEQQAIIQENEAALTIAERQVKRFSQMLEAGAVSANQIDRMILEVQTKKSKINNAKNAIKRTETEIKKVKLKIKELQDSSS
ncbi:MAG: PT domain-containing protein [Calothrix sp. MO_192.B10]|nr:PT domain-containing protein [Calothrix sp. MO_192.B10]